MTGNTAREGLDNPIGKAGAFSSYITGAPVEFARQMPVCEDYSQLNHYQGKASFTTRGMARYSRYASRVRQLA